MWSMTLNNVGLSTEETREIRDTSTSAFEVKARRNHDGYASMWGPVEGFTAYHGDYELSL